ncbi:hypothetical protein JCM5353_002407 [Sporobolomyces roseus]
MSIDFEITLNGVTEDLRMTAMPSSLDEFVNEVKINNVFATSSINFDRVKSFEYQGLNRDGYDDVMTVSDASEYEYFVSFAVDEHRTISVKLNVEPAVSSNRDEPERGEDKSQESKETKNLLEKIKKALETDHSLAGKLKEIVDEVCGSHPPDHRRGHSETWRKGKRHSPGERGRPPFEYGRFPHPRHCHDHSDDCNELPPPFPPFDRPLTHLPQFPHSPSPAHYAQSPPSPSSWNVDRVIYETWTPSFRPPSPFFAPPPRAHHHPNLAHHRSGRGRFPRHYPAPHPSFERGRPEFPPFGFPPPSASHRFPSVPVQRLPPREEHGREIPGGFPRRQKSHGCCPSPPVPAEYRRSRPHEEAGAEDWEVDFEELSVH